MKRLFLLISLLFLIVGCSQHSSIVGQDPDPINPNRLTQELLDTAVVKAAEGIVYGKTHSGCSNCFEYLFDHAYAYESSGSEYPHTISVGFEGTEGFHFYVAFCNFTVVKTATNDTVYVGNLFGGATYLTDTDKWIILTGGFQNADYYCNDL